MLEAIELMVSLQYQQMHIGWIMLQHCCSSSRSFSLRSTDEFEWDLNSQEMVFHRGRPKAHTETFRLHNLAHWSYNGEEYALVRGQLVEIEP